MSTATITEDAVSFFREHAGSSYYPGRETREQGTERTAREYAATEAAFLADPDVFVVWEVDDVDSSFFGDPGEPHALYCALLCRDAGDGERPDVTRGYDPSDGIFERPGVVVGSLGAVDLGADGHPSADPYARVVVAELYGELEAQRESNVTRRELIQTTQRASKRGTTHDEEHDQPQATGPQAERQRARRVHPPAPSAGDQVRR